MKHSGIKKNIAAHEFDSRNDNTLEITVHSGNTLQAALPVESFVPFDAYRVKYARVTFLNPFMDITEEEALEYAYAIKTESSDLFFLDEKKSMLAERYGGAGISNHGGGVRCGLGEKYQIKGVGTNPLVGMNSDFWHSHGSISLTECMYETLWGEVLNRILPYGAIRCPAIILTNGLSWVKTNNGEHKTQQARALLIRQPGLRPAHFERAYMYRPINSSKHLGHDTLRTKAAIAKLPDALPKPDNLGYDEWKKLPKLVKIELGLKELCIRVAKQTAVARAKRFMHGASVSSNLCIDGKWIDYDTTSFISCYADVITGEGQRSFWEEHLKFYYIINEICFYLHKYYPVENKSVLVKPLTLRQHYYQQFELALVKEFINLTGVPGFIIDQVIHKEESSTLASLLIKMARSGNDQKIAYIPDDATRTGDYDISTILFVSAFNDSRDDLFQKLKDHIPDEQLRDDYSCAYCRFMSFVIREVIENSILPLNGFKLLCKIRAAKGLKSIPMLYRHKAFSKLADIANKYSSLDDIKELYNRLFLRTLDEVDILYGTCQSVRELMWKKDDQEILFDPYNLYWVYMKGTSIKYTFEFSLAFDDNNMPPELFRMREWWGSSIFNEFNIQ